MMHRTIVAVIGLVLTSAVVASAGPRIGDGVVVYYSFDDTYTSGVDTYVTDGGVNGLDGKVVVSRTAGTTYDMSIDFVSGVFGGDAVSITNAAPTSPAYTWLYWTDPDDGAFYQIGRDRDDMTSIEILPSWQTAGCPDPKDTDGTTSSGDMTFRYQFQDDNRAITDALTEPLPTTQYTLAVWAYKAYNSEHPDYKYVPFAYGAYDSDIDGRDKWMGYSRATTATQSGFYQEADDEPGYEISMTGDGGASYGDVDIVDVKPIAGDPNLLVYDEWHHLAWVIDTEDGATGTWRFYINGVEEGSGNLDYQLSMYANWDAGALVGSLLDTSRVWEGELDEFYVFNTALTEDEVVTLATLPGDADLDRSVDVNDLGVLATNYGLTGKSWTEGDFNGDGDVDVIDLGVLATWYGESQTAAAAAVPEPSTLCLLLLGSLALVWRRRK